MLKNNNIGNTDNCGGKGSIIPVPEFIFSASCLLIHDTNYTIGGIEEDRLRADRGFLKYMLIDCWRYSGIRRVWYVFWAYIYYWAVRMFGRKYFNYKKQK